jgi:hypothetical protein
MSGLLSWETLSIKQFEIDERAWVFCQKRGEVRRLTQHDKTDADSSLCQAKTALP